MKSQQTLMFRVGQGYDSHRFGMGDQFVLGGVSIPHEHSVIAHSDGDVVVHALCDALLGAAALGDIGTHFPDHDPKYSKISSLELLTAVKEKLDGVNYVVQNVDATIILEAPKIGRYLEKMRENLAAVLEIAPAHISIKAKTNEKMGWLGRGEGLAAQVVVLLVRVAV